MPARITSSQKRKMFLAWYECRTIRGVMRECKCAQATAERLRVSDKWDHQAAFIDSAVRRQDQSTTAQRRAEHVVIARSAISKMVDDLDADQKFRFHTGDFDRLCRLIEYLSGEDESSHGRGADVDKLKEYVESLSVEERRRLANAGQRVIRNGGDVADLNREDKGFRLGSMGTSDDEGDAP